MAEFIYNLSIFCVTPFQEFNKSLTKLKETIERNKPLLLDNNGLDGQTEEVNKFKDQLRSAEDLVLECSRMTWNINAYKKFIYSIKLKDMNASLKTAIELVAENLKKRMEERSHSRFSSRIPFLNNIVVIGFENQVRDLKMMVLNEPVIDNCSVVVVSAARGCGKTTLVTMLRLDTDIQDKYGENIFYVKVTETPNFMVIVNTLIYSYSTARESLFESIKDAQDKLENCFREKVSGPILLILEDVQSESFIKKFEFKIKGYKILVTSKNVFPNYDMFQLDPLDDQDAAALFHRWAKPGPTIENDLVIQIVKCCKNHPLTLSAVASSLNGKCEWVWKSLLKLLSKGIDVEENVQYHLERTTEELAEKFKQSLLEFEALTEDCKKYLLDLGLFPVDQRIPAGVLLDMWVHMYDHDHMGKDTLTKLFELFYRDLITSITIQKDTNATVNYCEQTFVTQEDLLRELAVHLSGNVPIAHRPRLLIDVQGKYLPASITQLQEPIQACILSISTGEYFSSRWCNLKVPNVEVLVLNLFSKLYTLPPFLEEMPRLKILNIINYGLDPVVFENFNLLGRLSNLRRMRLECVSIPSLSRSTLAFVNLEKVSFMMCKIGNAFKELGGDNLNVWPSLVEIEMDNCQDLVEFPRVFCSCVDLKMLSITNCNEISGLPEQFSKLTSLETLSLHSCTKLEKLPDSFKRLQNLSILDISDCSSLSEMPEQIGNLRGLEAIYMKGCTGIHELPPSVEELSQIQVVCDGGIFSKWKKFPNVKINVVEEDRLLNIVKNISCSPF